MENQSIANKKILIVEDETPILKALTDILEIEKFTVLNARDGEEGLKLAFEEKPDLLLVDILMPKMDGLTMLKKLREDIEWGKDVPVMIMTNLNDMEKIAQAFEKGAYEYLIKTDWSLKDVVRKVKEKLKIE